MHSVFVVVTSIMASKRERVSRGSSSRVAPTPITPTFPNLKFLFEAHVYFFSNIVDYHIVKERLFDLSDFLRDFEKIGENLNQRKWVSFNNLIHETNNTIGLEFDANVAFGDLNSYIAYVRGRYIDYFPSSINTLFNLQPHPVFALMNYRQEHKVINEDMAHVMLNLFCRPKAAWVSTTSQNRRVPPNS